MTIDFTDSPSAGAEYLDQNGNLWTFDGQSWNASHLFGSREWNQSIVIVGNKDDAGYIAFGQLDYTTGAHGAYAAFFGKSHATFPGYFVITANSPYGSPASSTIWDLVGKPNGDLTWGGYDVYHEGNPPPSTGPGGGETISSFLLMGA
jgi:hypothetical protein